MGVLSLLSVTHLRIKLDLISLKRMKKTVIPPAYVTHRYLKKKIKNKNITLIVVAFTPSVNSL